ncbi:MAG: nitrogen fixation protein [Alphaproteobacteria bacterium]|nr:nitrogen fixation protein [Alphaproteobacteria bacterium]
MKIGVSSQNFRTITGHAGKGRRFLIYVGNDKNQPEEIDRIDLPKEMAINNIHRKESHPLDQLDVLITESCGEGFYLKMLSRGIKVIATSETDPIKAVTSFLAGEELPPANPHESKNPRKLNRKLKNES